MHSKKKKNLIKASIFIKNIIKKINKSSFSLLRPFSQKKKSYSRHIEDGVYVKIIIKKISTTHYIIYKIFCHIHIIIEYKMHYIFFKKKKKKKKKTYKFKIVSSNKYR